MTSHKFWFWLSLFVFLIALILLLTGSPLLTLALSENPEFPLGNLITWAGLIALPMCILLGSKGLRNPHTQFGRILKAALKGVVVLAVLWVPLSALLAGNLTNTFSEKASFQGGQTAMRLFWIYSYSLASVPLLILIFSGLLRFFSKKKT